MGATTIHVGNEAELNQAIASADAATSGSFDIVFTAPTITEGTDLGNSSTFGAQTLSAPPDLYALNLTSVWPVRVLAHAFGAGFPTRDLLLSPDHSLFVAARSTAGACGGGGTREAAAPGKGIVG